MTKSRGVYAPRGAPALERLEHHLDKSSPSGCWNYKGYKNALGYGVFGDLGKTQLAHRVMFSEVVGVIPAGKIVLHRCDNPTCCNPAHLVLGTPKDNSDDMIGKGRENHPPQIGEINPSAKLTDETVREARLLYAGGTPQEELARKYGVSQTTISKMLSRKTWRHV